MTDRNIKIISKTKFLEQALKACHQLGDYSFVSKDAAILIEDNGNSISINGTDFPKPIKLEKLINHILSLKPEGEYLLGDLRFNASLRKILHLGEEITLTEKETAILSYLLSYRNASKEDMLARIWKYDKSANTSTLETHIYRLRQKLSQYGITDLIMNTAGSYSINAQKYPLI